MRNLLGSPRFSLLSHVYTLISIYYKKSPRSKSRKREVSCSTKLIHTQSYADLLPERSKTFVCVFKLAESKLVKFA